MISSTTDLRIVLGAFFMMPLLSVAILANGRSGFRQIREITPTE